MTIGVSKPVPPYLVPTLLLARTLNCALEEGGNLCVNLYCLVLSLTSTSHSPRHWSHSSSYWVMGEPLSWGAFQRRVRVFFARLDILGGSGLEGGWAWTVMLAPTFKKQLVHPGGGRAGLTWGGISLHVAHTGGHCEVVGVA